jgi:hypothetical protein
MVILFSDSLILGFQGNEMNVDRVHTFLWGAILSMFEKQINIALGTDFHGF